MCDPSISSKEIFFIERIIYKMPHTLLPELAQDYTHLREYFQALDTDGIAIAYSGGVDSTLLLKVACEASSRPVLAVILETELHPHSEIETAVAMAKKLKAGMYCHPRRRISGSTDSAKSGQPLLPLQASALHPAAAAGACQRTYGSL